MAVSLLFKYRDGVHLVDSDNTDDDDSDLVILRYQVMCFRDSLIISLILEVQGTMLENFVTKSKVVFQSLLRSSGVPPREDIATRREAYRYAKVWI